MNRGRTILWVWLLAGLGLFAHDAAGGGGLAGFLLLWQLDRFGAIAPGVTYIALAIPLIAVPGFMLLPRSRKRAPEPPLSQRARRLQWIVCVSLSACLAVFGVMAFQQAERVPGEAAPLVRFTIVGSATNATLPADARIVLQGTPQPDHAVAYDEVTFGKFRPDLREPHRYVPMTGGDWTPARPVYFVADLGEATQLAGLPMPGIALRTTRPGIVLRDAVPGWLRSAFAERGVTLADDARVHTTDWRGERNGWYAAAGIAAAASVLCMLGGIALR